MGSSRGTERTACRNPQECLKFVSGSRQDARCEASRRPGYLSRQEEDAGQLNDLQRITSTIKSNDPDIDPKWIMAVHPARAYYLGSNYMMLPEYYEGESNELIDYGGLEPRVRAYAPKFPWDAAASELRADYLIYDQSALESIPQFSFLLTDPTSPEVPDEFELVYRSDEVAVYEIEDDR